MAKKAAAVVLLILALAPQGFSKARWYVKATTGGGYLNVSNVMLYSYSYSDRFGNYYEDSDSAIFALKPAAGIEWRGVRDDGTPGIVGFALEAQVGLGFGRDSWTGASMVAVEPGIMGILSFASRFHLWRFVPYLGVGLSVPMVFFGESSREYSYSSSSYSYSESYSFDDGFAYSLFDANFLLGFGVAITENIMPVLEAQCNLGFGGSNNMMDIEVRLGCVYKFGK